MLTVNDLEAQIYRYQARICDLKAQISELESDYENLSRFKGVVSGSEQEFGSAAAGKKGVLTDLNAVQANCRTARLYSEGMERLLSGTGADIVGVVYDGLLGVVGRYMSGCAGKCNRLDGEIGVLEGKIFQLRQQISAMQAAELAASVNPQS